MKIIGFCVTSKVRKAISRPRGCTPQRAAALFPRVQSTFRAIDPLPRGVGTVFPLLSQRPPPWTSLYVCPSIQVPLVGRQDSIWEVTRLKVLALRILLTSARLLIRCGLQIGKNDLPGFRGGGQSAGRSASHPWKELAVRASAHTRLLA